MFVPFSVTDFIDRARTVYGERVGVVDEPDQPAPSLGGVTYAELAALARRQAAKLDELGLEVGDRVAVVSHNSARLLTSFFGVTGSGRVLVPVNFRLRPDEVSYIVEHSGARVLYVDPELDEELAGVTAEHRFVLGDDGDLSPPRASSRGRGSRTRTPPPASTTPPAPPRAPRACRSRTATSGSTRSPSPCTRRSPTATSTCTRCRCSTPTAGGCRSR